MIFGKPICPRYKTVVSAPDIPKEVFLHYKGKDPKMFPVAKYICVAKTMESRKKYKVRGVPRITKVYGVGVLTDKNQYYFSEIHTNHIELTYSNRLVLQQALTSKYILTPETKVAVGDNINEKDPIYAFLRIVGSAVGFLVKRKAYWRMLRALNIRFKYVKKARAKNYSVRKWHIKYVLQSLIDHDRFDFITDPDWQEKLSTKTGYVTQAFYECAVGILFLFQKELNVKYFENTIKNKQMRQLEEVRKEAEKKKKP